MSIPLKETRDCQALGRSAITNSPYDADEKHAGMRKVCSHSNTWLLRAMVKSRPAVGSPQASPCFERAGQPRGQASPPEPAPAMGSVGQHFQRRSPWPARLYGERSRLQPLTSRRRRAQLQPHSRLSGEQQMPSHSELFTRLSGLPPRKLRQHFLLQ